MALHKIEKTLDKYFEGETTIVEENDLKSYFTSTNVAPHLKQYQPLFNHFVGAKQEKLKPNIQLFLLPQNRKRNLIMWLSVAASAVILLSVGTFMYFDSNNSSQFVSCNSQDDPKIVLQETQRALALVSEKLNTGIESVSYINEFDNSKNRIFKK